MSIYKKLSNIQNELNVPKNQRNTFGNYNFRSAEDILEVAKPVCKKHETVLIVSDKIITQGDRVYVEATAKLSDFEGNAIEVTASAREAVSQKGMNDAQITGSSSSYARKYALGGLFNLDDNKDPDATNKHGQEEDLNSTLVQRDKINTLSKEGKINLEAALKYYKVEVVDELKFKQAEAIIKKGNKK
jgi:hypothetical protein